LAAILETIFSTPEHTVAYSFGRHIWIPNEKGLLITAQVPIHIKEA
jgi:hypothetical protein